MNKRNLIAAIVALTLFSASYAMGGPAGTGCETATFEKSGNSYSIDVTYPEITDKKLSGEERQKLNGEIKSFVFSLFEKELKTFQKAKWTMEQLKHMAGSDWVNIKFKVVRFDEKILSVKFEKYATGIGAAHGSTDFYGFNYDLKKGHILKISDIFYPGQDYLKQISDYCINDLCQQLNRPDDHWIKSGISPDEDEFRAFAIGKKNLIIYFSDYAIAGYSMGTQKVSIPFDKLIGLKLVYR